MTEGVEPSNISDQSYLKNKSMIKPWWTDDYWIQKLVYQIINMNCLDKKSQCLAEGFKIANILEIFHA